MANSTSGESVVSRVARLLQCFDADHGELSAAELAGRAGLSTSTTHRLASAMAEDGLLFRTGRGRFRIGLALWEAGQRGTRFQAFSQLALPFMEAIHVTLKQNVSLSILDESTAEIVYLERLTHRGAQEDLTKVALRQPALSVSAGLAMLAFSPAPVQERILSMPWDPSALQSGVTEGHMRRRLAQARVDGYVHLPGVLVGSLAGLAAPILDAHRQVLGALAIVQTMADVNLKVQVPVLLSATRGLSGMVGTLPSD
ncbi:helix-turn-helix domain-containing protein [Citricoccus sp.]|uniref:IclR family transcriptional regulator n=1 Tax=Citricoccus sp. TaxID=1978372 RepID=UPI0028BDA96F|nr:helix-turn-helix domain-containing protein [Citricoccus sp.]